MLDAPDGSMYMAIAQAWVFLQMEAPSAASRSMCFSRKEQLTTGFSYFVMYQCL
ncbi:MAG: hypothetical protein ACI9MC_001113 [Kiritimatiellia bacterium]|jgi:hypothetical protein